MIAVQLPEDGSVIQDALYAGISFRVLFLNLMFYCIEKGGLKWGGRNLFHCHNSKGTSQTEEKIKIL